MLAVTASSEDFWLCTIGTMPVTACIGVSFMGQIKKRYLVSYSGGVTILPYKIQRVPVGGAVERMLYDIETASVFQDNDGNRCFLNANRNDGKRKLNLVNLNGNWSADNDWVFLEVLFSPA